MTDATATPAPKKRRWTFWRVLLYLFVYAFAFMFLGIFGAGLIAFIVYDHVTQPGHPGELITVTIPKGATGKKVGEVLAEAELVEYEGFFVLLRSSTARCNRSNMANTTFRTDGPRRNSLRVCTKVRIATKT